MAGSLDSRARRVQRLEGRGLERPEPSRTELEAWALDAEIRKLKEEIRAFGEDPDEWRPDVRMDLPLDEQIAELEKELEQC
jgi:hypothetical protein